MIDAPEPLHVDDGLIVVDKPSGLLAVPGRGADKQDCLAARVQARWPDVLVVHRLDQATSGLMLFARGPDAQRRLARCFEERAVDKRYVAVVAGRVAGGSGCIDLPIAADWPRRPLRCIDAAHGRPSQTRWQVIEHDPTGERTRLALDPVTGRTHQLRVHLLAIGHPILGDTLYAPPAVQALAPRLLLHAQGLAFPHPVTGEALRFESAPPF